jgi:secondary thiamine-phosphate synthase enzyme
MQMKQYLAVLGFETQGRGLLEITEDLRQWMRETDVRVGLLTIHCQHTSASILINENAAPAVRSDILHWLDKVAPRSDAYAHDSEGPDDMPAHLKTALTGVNLSIPVADGRMMLGTWQGIFLAEHRAQPHKRSVAVHLIGE